MLLALGLRIGFTLSTAHWPEFTHPLLGLDVDVLWQSAIELNTGIPDEPRFALMQASAPGFTFLLAGTQKLLGLSLYNHRLLMTFIGSLTVLFLMISAWSWHKNRRITLTTGLLAALYPASIYFDTQLIKTSPEMLLISILLAWMLNFRCHSVLQGFLQGAGLSTLMLCLIASQFAALFLPLAIVLWLIMKSDIAWQQRAATVVMLLLLTAAGGWLLQQPERWMPDKYGAFLPASGVHSYIGFHPGATGNYHNIPDVPASPYGHTFVSRIAAENAVGKPLSSSQANQYWQEKTLAFVEKNPTETLHILLKKVRIFVSSHETKANEYLPSIQSRSALLQAIPLNWGILLTLATIGFFGLRKLRDPNAYPVVCIILCVLAANLLTFVTWRYRIHALAPLLLLAGYGLAQLPAILKCIIRPAATQGAFRNNVMAIVATIAVMALTFWPLPTAVITDMQNRSHHNEGMNLRFIRMEAELTAIQDKTGIYDRIQQASLLHQLQRHTESYRLLQSIIATTTDSSDANALWITYLAALGDTAETRDFIIRLLNEKPAILVETWKRLAPSIQLRCQKLGLVPKRKTP